MDQHKAQFFFCKPYDKRTHSLIESEIIRNEFKPESIWGFRLVVRRSTYLQAVYIEKKTIVERVTDPFGKIADFERVVYTQIDFQLSLSKPNIIIFKPPRNYRKLLNQLAQFSNFSIAIENKSVDLFDWVKILNDHGITGEIVKINVDPVRYDKLTFGKLMLVGKKELQKRVTNLLSDVRYEVKNLKLEFTGDQGGIPNVELYRDGKVDFAKSIDSEKFKIFSDTFCQLV